MWGRPRCLNSTGLTGQQLCFPLTYPHPAWRPSAIRFPVHKCPLGQLLLTCPHFWSEYGKKQKDILKVNAGTKEKGKIRGDQGRRQSILRHGLVDLSNSGLHIFTKSLGHMGNWRKVLFGARVGGIYQVAVQGSQEAEAGTQGQPGLNSETLSSQGKYTWNFLLFISIFHIFLWSG